VCTDVKVPLCELVVGVYLPFDSKHHSTGWVCSHKIASAYSAAVKKKMDDVIPQAKRVKEIYGPIKVDGNKINNKEKFINYVLYLVNEIAHQVWFNSSTDEENRKFASIYVRSVLHRNIRNVLG
jgi:hypothetical protein